MSRGDGMSGWRALAMVVLGSWLWACSDGSAEESAVAGAGGGSTSSTASAGGSDAHGGAGGGVGGMATTGVGGSGGSVDPMQPITVVVLGSSTACGKNLDEPTYGGMAGDLVFSWPNRYADHLAGVRPGSSVVNLCQPGYVTYQAMPTGTTNPNGLPPPDDAKNITAALTYDPDAVILAYPGVSETSNLPEILSNIATIVAAAQGVPVWIQTAQPGGNMTPAARDAKIAYDDMLMAAHGDRVLDFWGALALPDDSGWDPAFGLLDDAHPNKLGHEQLFDVVVAAQIPETVFGSN